MISKRKITKKIIGRWQGHIARCDTCFEMERRGYYSENRYWDDFFGHKLRPIKYKLFWQDGSKVELDLV